MTHILIDFYVMCVPIVTCDDAEHSLTSSSKDDLIIHIMWEISVVTTPLGSIGVAELTKTVSQQLRHLYGPNKIVVVIYFRFLKFCPCAACSGVRYALSNNPLSVLLHSRSLLPSDADSPTDRGLILADPSSYNWSTLHTQRCAMLAVSEPTGTTNTTVGPSVEQERSGLREAEHEWQAVLQEMPSHCRCGISGEAENWVPSPTPGASRAQVISVYLFISLRRPLGLGTPPDSQASALAPAPIARTLVQHAQREHEAAAKVVGAPGAPNRPPRADPAPPNTQRSASQQARRQQEPHIPLPRVADPVHVPPPPRRQRRPAGCHHHRNSDRPAAPRMLLARCPYVEPDARHDLGRMDVKCRHCGALHWLAEKIAKLADHSPKCRMCCNHGKVVIDSLVDPH
ncbi:hypothetical protein B0H10DRAFT_1937757 [Mycena sp. CBHHK59/15]|nr:hypothetical protein B0H10DRAFT_1937757 [Mycena sp. CBHHK59/15]